MDNNCQALTDLCRQLHKASADNGWWDDIDEIAQTLCCLGEPMMAESTLRYAYAAKLALIHSEVSEMLEGLRKGQLDEHLPEWPAEWVEAADIFIRLADYCGRRGIPLGATVYLKQQYNDERADHKREARDSAEGKKF